MDTDVTITHGTIQERETWQNCLISAHRDL